MATIRLRFVNSFRNKRRKDARVRHYFRHPRCKAVALPGQPGSEEFMQAYAMALASVPERTTEIGASRTLPETINALVVAYYKSDGWQRLANDTHKARRPIIERFRNQYGALGVKTLERGHIEKMLA